MAGGGVRAPQVFYQSARLLGIGPVKGKGLAKVRWFLRDGRWIIASTRYSPGNTRLLGRMARSGDRAPQAVYRKCRGLRGTGCPARHWPCAKRGKRRKSLCPRIKFALSPSIEVKGFRKLQKVFFSFPREGDAAALSGKAAKGCAVDRARPVFSFSALRKGGAPAGAQRSGSGGERRKERSLSGIFGLSRKWSGGVSSDDMGGAMNQPSSWLKSPPPVRASKIPSPRQGFPLQINLPPI